MRHRTIRILLLLAVAATAFAGFAPAGFARHGDDDGDHVRGTIASFAGGILTIRQSDGDEIRGRVTRRTEIECERRGDRRHDRDDDEDGDDHHRGRGRDDDGEHRRSHDRDGCGRRQLTVGRAVREAELTTTGSGLVFREIEIVS
jgi:hypothetical protein